jgi:hypothetical protein
VVFRDAQHAVQFAELNAVTARVLVWLDEGQTGQQALAQLAREMHHPDPQALMAFGHTLLTDLRAQGVILGAAT